VLREGTKEQGRGCDDGDSIAKSCTEILGPAQLPHPATANSSTVNGRVGSVSNDFLFQAPDRCKKCQELASVRLEQTLKGSLVVLTWCCRVCGFEWPVLPSEHIQRRRAPADRRKLPRGERRKPPQV
jgi:hypothetical protein